MPLSLKYGIKSILILFLTTILLSPLLSAKDMSQQKQNKKDVKFIPIVLDDLILMIKIDNGGSGTIPATKLLKKTGQTTIYYTYDDGYYEKGVTPSYSRTNEVVTDHVTGLEWQDNAATNMVRKRWVTPANTYAGNYSDTSGDTATTYCSTLALDGGGWRLPTVQELQSIVVIDGADNPSIDTTIFVNYSATDSWSSTTSARYSTDAWIVIFSSGSTYDAHKGDINGVRCVR